MISEFRVPLANPIIGREERLAVDRVLASGQLAQGPETEAFEAEFSAWVAGRKCIAVNSGTTALQLCLLAADIGTGDEVIVPSFTFAATANAVRLCGAVPVFADIEPRSFCVDPESVEAAVTPRTAAVIAVHLYGHPADVETLGAIAKRHHLVFIEDAAQAHGAVWGGRPVGSFGAMAAFSFYPTKNMTTGEGGMVVTDDLTLARAVRILRNQGMQRRYHNELVGMNGRMTDIAAAIGRVQLGRLAEWNETRRTHARYFDSTLQGITTPTVRAGASHVYNQYTVRVHDRAGLQRTLARHGIATGIYYPVPVHRLPSYTQSADLPETERAAREVLSLPVRPDLAAEDLAAVVRGVNDWAGRR